MPNQRRRRDGRRGQGRGRRRRLLQPALLLELRGGPSHGYAMLEGLSEFGFGDEDPSMVYRALRDMEVEGWVTSSWEPHETQGPPRRVYSLTTEGESVLAEWTKDLEQWRARIDRFLRAYQTRTGNDGQKSPEKGE